MDKTDISERTYSFALRIIKLTRRLPKNIAGDSLGRQLIRAGTSIGANVEEAQAGFTKKDFTYTDPETKKEFVPWIVETSGGVDRTFLFLLLDAYKEEKDRIVLSLSPRIAPYKIAVFPLLSNKPQLVKQAKKIYEDLKTCLPVVWDDRGNIGKRYYAQDEIGTPWCVTIDFQTLEDKTVTIRDRDTTQQKRLKVDKLEEWFQNKLSK